MTTRRSKQFRKIYNSLTTVERDLLIACPVCRAKQEYFCLGVIEGTVHFGRRLRRLLSFPERIE